MEHTLYGDFLNAYIEASLAYFNSKHNTELSQSDISMGMLLRLNSVCSRFYKENKILVDGDPKGVAIKMVLVHTSSSGDIEFPPVEEIDYTSWETCENGHLYWND